MGVTFEQLVKILPGDIIWQYLPENGKIIAHVVTSVDVSECVTTTPPTTPDQRVVVYLQNNPRFIIKLERHVDNNYSNFFMTPEEIPLTLDNIDWYVESLFAR